MEDNFQRRNSDDQEEILNQDNQANLITTVSNIRLPPANPVIVGQEHQDYKVNTALKFEFDELPEFNKSTDQAYEQKIQSNASIINQERISDALLQIKQTTLPLKVKGELKNGQFDEENDNQGLQDQLNTDLLPKEANHTNNIQQQQQQLAPQQIFQLIQFHRKNQDKCIYLRYSDFDSDKPCMLNNRVYFATYLYNLKDIIDAKEKEKIQINKQEEYQAPELVMSLQQSENSLIQPQEDHLVFNSRFQSGNLFSAYQKSQFQYDLIMQNDINTKGNTQWFFFSVKNTKATQTIQFNILNHIKSGSLFSHGMKPVVYSKQLKEFCNVEWKRQGEEIKYYKGNINRDGFRERFYYNDEVYFAHSFPYTYTNLASFIERKLTDQTKMYILFQLLFSLQSIFLSFVKQKTLCRTLFGNLVQVLTVTSNSNLNRGTREGVVILARQHPGETGGSYMMEGIINFLLSEHPEAAFLRDYCVFKLIPMINPDGVIHGNYRTCLSGVDLNRKWQNPQKKILPALYHVQQMVQRFHKERGIQFFIDLHGHSRKLNSFVYGCTSYDDPYSSRIFPYLLSKITNLFSFDDSQFIITNDKMCTARVIMFQELKISNVYTIEASFYGSEQQETDNNSKVNDYGINEYREIGKKVVENIFNMVSQEVKKKEEKMQDNKPIQPEDVTTSKIYQEIIDELKEQIPLMKVNDMDHEEGSDSSPSEDQLDDKQKLKIIPRLYCTKRQKKASDDEKPKKMSEDLIKKQVVNLPQTIVPPKPHPQIHFQNESQHEPPQIQKVETVDKAIQTDASFIRDLKNNLFVDQNIFSSKQIKAQESTGSAAGLNEMARNFLTSQLNNPFIFKSRDNIYKQRMEKNQFYPHKKVQEQISDFQQPQHPPQLQINHHHKTELSAKKLEKNTDFGKRDANSENQKDFQNVIQLQSLRQKTFESQSLIKGNSPFKIIQSDNYPINFSQDFSKLRLKTEQKLEGDQAFEITRHKQDKEQSDFINGYFTFKQNSESKKLENSHIEITRNISQNLDTNRSLRDRSFSSKIPQNSDYSEKQKIKFNSQILDDLQQNVSIILLPTIPK